MQKQTELSSIYDSFNDYQMIKSLQNELGIQEGIQENAPDYATSLEKINNSQFQNTINHHYRISEGDFAIVNRNFYAYANYNYDVSNKIIMSTFDKEKEYIRILDEKYSLEKMTDTEKESLLKFLTSHINDDEQGAYLQYCIDNHQISYLKWGNETYGESTSKIKKAYVSDFHILDHVVYLDIARNELIVVDIKDIQQAIQQVDFHATENVHAMVDVNIHHQTFFISLGYLGGDYDSNDNETRDKNFLNIMTISVADHFDSYILGICMQQNRLPYTFALIALILVSWCLSTIITYPIFKIQQAALKIANNDFSEEIKVKSNDEIGSLAKSIDTMRIQLKHTIEQLHLEMERVKELEALRKDFINQFTHEMKTPLGIINGYSELIEEAENEEEIEKYLKIINRETTRVNQLIQSMLSLSRLEAGKVELVKEEFDLEDLITEVIDEYEVLLMKKNAKITIHTKDTMIYGDPCQLKIVVENFLSNAIKHVYSNGKIIINIDRGLSLFNEGHQIKEEQIDNIWYTFVTHDQDGSGLGLAICRSILELHGYQYGVCNQETGVQFYFYQTKNKENQV